MKNVSSKQKKANKKAKELSKVKERELLFSMQALARGEKIEKSEKFFSEKKPQKERFFSILTGKRVKEEQYYKDLDEYSKKRGGELIISPKKIKDSEPIVKKTWKQLKDSGKTKLSFKDFFESYQKNIAEKLTEFILSFDVNAVSESLSFAENSEISEPEPENSENSEPEKWKIYANNEEFILPELAWYLREVQQEIREFYGFWIGAKVNKKDKTVKIWFDMSDLKDASDNGQIIYEEHFTFQKVTFNNIKVVFSSQ